MFKNVYKQIFSQFFFLVAMDYQCFDLDAQKFVKS